MSFIVAIDGTSGSGKTTTAKKVANRLGWFYLDTGSTYRAIAFYVLKKGIDPEDKEKVTQSLNDVRMKVSNVGGEQHTYINGNDVTPELRTDEVDNAVTPVSKMKSVREWLVKEQRRIVNNKNAVVEGRDIGTVVFPDADLKVFMDAELEVRANRRKKQKNNKTTFNKVKDNLKKRDYHDSTRTESPLKRAEDSLYLDTTSLTIEQQVDWVVSKIKLLNESPTSI